MDGKCDKGCTWILASKDDWKVYEWHQIFYEQSTFICALDCHVLSNASVIGSVEMNWNDNNKVCTPSRNRTKVERCDKMTNIFGYHCAFKYERWHERESRAGKLCNEEDFASLKLD